MIPGTTIPKPTVALIGNDGNAFAILGACLKALRGAKVPAEVVAEFRKQATAGDYDNLLRVCMGYVEVE
jgi:hypothetical protein